MKTPTLNRKVARSKFLLLNILLLFSISALAQENQNTKGESPYFYVISSDPSTDQLPLKNARATVNIAGVIADVTITQEYTNEGQKPLEAIYISRFCQRGGLWNGNAHR